MEAVPCREFISLLIASLHEGWLLIPHQAEEDCPVPVCARADLRRKSCILQPDGTPGPAGGGIALQSSGTTGTPVLYRLSPENLLSVWNSHFPQMQGLKGCRAWCGLPLHHAFGLVLDLMPALLEGEAVVLPDADPRDMQALQKRWKEDGVTRACGVPLFFQRLMEEPHLLSSLRGGIMGGAPCPESLAKGLQGTAIQPGYGLTEASPGVMLGDPGEWSRGEMGRPLGCEATLSDTGTLFFRGKNAVSHRWSNGEWQPLGPDRWVDTGDLAERCSDGRYRFIGRSGSGWKLDNGRWLQPEPLEQQLQEHLSLEDAPLLLLPSAEDRELILVTADPEKKDLSCYREALGPLAGRLTQVIRCQPAEWIRTQKGETDRRAMQERVIRFLS